MKSLSTLFVAKKTYRHFIIEFLIKSVTAVPLWRCTKTATFTYQAPWEFILQVFLEPHVGYTGYPFFTVVESSAKSSMSEKNVFQTR